MPPVDLILAIHDHQPVGNFEHVLEDSYQRAYRPFLAVLERHPGVRIALHQTGILWDWMEARHPDAVDAVARLVTRGQVELLSGGYYEPILAAIPERDRQGQIAKLTSYLESRFGVRPRGAWVAERVWEPQLAATLARAGIEFTILDDAHFESAGIPPRHLDGYYVTEEDGHTLRVFAIRRKLRELIPFAAPEETLHELAAWAASPAHATPPLLVLADDGEKFGAWPGTHALCYERGWLERFFALLEANADWVRIRTFSECLDRSAPRGRAYLPEAAYAEMMEWALPPAAQRRLRQFRERLAESTGAPADGCVRGAPWRNFLVRYPESNWMHKRMLQVSHALAARMARAGGPQPALRPAEDALWKAQCNCAYWHGLFGGLYLPHLRSAVYAHLLQAERLLLDGGAPRGPEVLDLDADGLPEVILRSPDLQAIVKPDEGGALLELDDWRRSFNLLDLMTRREEAYHDAVRAAMAAGASGAGAVLAPGPDVPARAPALVYDAYRRGACIDHLLAPEASPAHFEAAALPELATLAGTSYGWMLSGDGVRLARAAALALPGTPLLRLTKLLRLDGPRLEAHYTLRNDGAETIDLRLGIEMAANLLAGDAPDRYYEAPGHALADRRLRSAGCIPEVRRLDLVDAWLDLRVRFESEPAAEVWRAPIETVSMSDHGLERVFQGSSLLFVHRVRLAPGATWTGLVRQGVEGSR